VEQETEKARFHYNIHIKVFGLNTVQDSDNSEAAFKRSNGNNLTISCTNFKFGKLPSNNLRVYAVKTLRNFDFRRVISNHFCTSCKKFCEIRFNDPGV